jgi:hypothetical protein
MKRRHSYFLLLIILIVQFLLSTQYLFATPLHESPNSQAFSSFYQNLADNKREEITVINNYSVKVGLGPDDRSVSCTILDAVGSIPSVNGSTEPDVVYVNKEKVHHIRKGLYAWDRNGKYRVRLTTKYIREFGEITIRIPSQPTAIEKTVITKTVPTYYESLPENKREEITIINDFMVEVGLGSDLGPVKSTIQNAIKSIPSVPGEGFPEFVSINGAPIFFIGNGLYSWDSEGNSPVRVTTTFINKFGKISVSVQENSPGGEPELEKQSAITIQPEELSIPKKKNITIASAPSLTTKAEVPAPAKKVNKLGLKGFRQARFGMDISQVKNAIQKDFNIDEAMIVSSRAQGNILTISTTRLSARGDEASVQYFFSPANNRLKKVQVSWEPSDNTDNLAVKLIEQFLSLRFLEKQPPDKAHLYYGKDTYGNTIKLSWAEIPKSSSQRPLLLSYLEFSK